MNLLYTITGYPPSVGGAQACFHQLAQQFAVTHRVNVATHWDETRTDWLLGTTLCAPRTEKQYEIDAIPVHTIALDARERAALVPAVLGYYALKGPAIDAIARRIARHLAPLAEGAALIHNGRMGREALSFASFAVARQFGIPF
ncbi:MAG: glycosyltransferase family 1 protein, partial [Anaerolineae bacterium]